MSDDGKTLRWRSLDGDGLEHCVVRSGAAGITAEGVAIGGAGGDGFGLRYRIGVDADWAGVRSLHLTLLGGATLALRHDGYGVWTDGQGKVRKDLAGALDLHVDGLPLPLTATLRRMAWKAGRAQELDTVRVAVPSLEVGRSRRKITPVEPGRLYRVTDAEQGERQVAVDAEGLVLDWQGLLIRSDGQAGDAARAVA